MKVDIARHRQPERYFYRLAFLSMILFGVCCVLVIDDPSDAAIDAMSFSYYVTIVIGVVSGLVAIYTP